MKLAAFCPISSPRIAQNIDSVAAIARTVANGPRSSVVHLTLSIVVAAALDVGVRATGAANDAFPLG